MTIRHLHYDILTTVLPFLDPPTLLQFAVVCQSYSQPALRRLWNRPRITHADKLNNFIQTLYRSIQDEQQYDHNHHQHQRILRPYYEWITGLTIAFNSFQPIPLLHTFQSILFHHLPNLAYLSLHHTHAVFSPSVQRYRVQFCLLEIPLSEIPGPITLTHHPSDNGNDPLPWLDLYFNIPTSLKIVPLPLTHISITHSSITGLLLNDDYLYQIALSCPDLRKIRVSGFFSDKGVKHVANSCHALEIISFSLPKGLAQSNTITQNSLDCLSISCPRLTQFTCLGQTRIDPTLAEHTFRLHCPHFSYCDFGPNV
ncbi:hypothetical protein BCR42DRAFT_401030 [Absidia repens]|uniref:F-box domain-containing protein n=1 Tax=Absidia repens TaxID=90262 RepID=A0A1X2J206_9FUNG|nr:hypothetical protein BCR42DRAFT_401030 [Absidia repens]